MTPTLTEADILNGFKGRDRTCTLIVLDWIRSTILRVHWARNLSPDDIVSDACAKLFEQLSRAGSDGTSSPKAFVRHVAKCTAVDALRREKRVQSLKENVKHSPPGNPNPEELMISDEEMRLYVRMRDQVGADCLALWDMLLVEGLTYKEIAKKLKTSDGALRVRNLRCKEKALALFQKMK